MKTSTLHNTVRMSHNRQAATLTEVLMSLLIMSIGIVSVFTLFPVSLISSIRATQLTNGRIFKDNIDELVRTVPQMTYPQLAGNSRGYWQPNTHYEVGDQILPTLAPSKLFPKPYYSLHCTTAGTSGSEEPGWSLTGVPYTEPSGGPTWETVRIPNYVIDPIGRYRSLVNFPLLFGNHRGIDNEEQALSSFPRRTYLPLLNEKNAVGMFASPDSWSVMAEGIPEGFGTGTITLPAGMDVTNISTDINQTRIVMTTSDRTRSIVRAATSDSIGQTLHVNSPPANLDSFTGPLRIETFSPRYTYLLAVSHTGYEYNAPPSLQCAIFFNRQFTEDAEYAYKANFGNPRFEGDAAVTDTTLRRDQVKIAWDPGTESAPFIKEGGYIFDARSMLFYRISSIQHGNGTAILNLNQNVVAMTVGNSHGWAVLMPGIINVYEFDIQ